MNSSDASLNSVSTNSEITRRNFMKKSLLTAGAVTFLAQGVGLAAGSSSGNYKHVWPQFPSSSQPAILKSDGTLIPGYDYYYCTKCSENGTAPLGGKPPTAGCTRP